MSNKPETANESRRNFLKLASATAPAAVAAAAIGATPVEAAEEAADGTTLKETAHTRAYFASARF